MNVPLFNSTYRKFKYLGFDIEKNSSGRGVVDFLGWKKNLKIYTNANLTLYSRQRCNAVCPFCIEELRPLQRGKNLNSQKRVLEDNPLYFQELNQTLKILKPLDPSVSITGGEPSLDPNLGGLLRSIFEHQIRKRTLTTNGTGLFKILPGTEKTPMDFMRQFPIHHLNISRAHPHWEENCRLMKIPPGICDPLSNLSPFKGQKTPSIRLSCVLIKSGIHSLDGILTYCDWVEKLGFDQVIFRQLMDYNIQTLRPNRITQFCTQNSIPLTPLLEKVESHGEFKFIRQVMGYYYYVEVWKYKGVTVTFEQANLEHLEKTRLKDPDIIHELIFHPCTTLCSTWQPWDGIIKPPPHSPSKI